MPTYEYACKDCGSHLEVVQSFSDDPLTECSHCGGPLRKVFGSIGITFKGSGFYKTDSRSGSPSTKPSSADGAKESSGDSSKETTTEKTEKKKKEPAASTSSSSDSSSGTAKTA